MGDAAGGAACSVTTSVIGTAFSVYYRINTELYKMNPVYMKNMGFIFVVSFARTGSKSRLTVGVSERWRFGVSCVTGVKGEARLKCHYDVSLFSYSGVRTTWVGLDDMVTLYE